MGSKSNHDRRTTGIGVYRQVVEDDGRHTHEQHGFGGRSTPVGSHATQKRREGRVVRRGWIVAKPIESETDAPNGIHVGFRRRCAFGLANGEKKRHGDQTQTST